MRPQHKPSPKTFTIPNIQHFSPRNSPGINTSKNFTNFRISLIIHGLKPTRINTSGNKDLKSPRINTSGHKDLKSNHFNTSKKQGRGWGCGPELQRSLMIALCSTPESRRSQKNVAPSSRYVRAGAASEDLPDGTIRGLFHGIFPSSVAIMQILLTPAKVKPAPTKIVPAKNHRETVNPKTAVITTTLPAIARTCRSSDHTFVSSRSSGNPDARRSACWIGRTS